MGAMMNRLLRMKGSRDAMNNIFNITIVNDRQ